MSKIFLKCVDQECGIEGGREFFFSDKEQKYYSEKKLLPPKRCWDCRKRNREERERLENKKNSPFATALKEASDRELMSE